ncbi:MAG TPA: class II aldolase/adducin family protein [bacterium]|nr:class II aldolase/adducin family protein [bacterium]HOC24645.1 class II aldolase/adducin family protein [bacterium]HOH06126.1 class II aldolase/adducin family protein [bacterium]HOY43862.1 class II aldolase/adducin family protein [bacterium]HPG84051.1 class II aldolase/adducin family protein [bacterium]
MAKSIQTLKTEIVEAGRRVWLRGYVAANDGNISARIDRKSILITPTGVSKGFLKPADLVVVDMEGRLLSGRKKPSSEVHMHLAIYRERPDVQGICHAHPPTATGFAVAGIPLDACVLPEVIITLGSIPVIPYGTPGTPGIYEPLLARIREHDAFLLANHGAVTTAGDVIGAYHKMETLEHFAHISLVARQLGRVNVLSETEAEALYALRERFGVTVTARGKARKK